MSGHKSPAVKRIRLWSLYIATFSLGTAVTLGPGLAKATICLLTPQGRSLDAFFTTVGAWPPAHWFCAFAGVMAVIFIALLATD